MKKASKILFFTFLGTILIGIIVGIILGGIANIFDSIGKFVGGIHQGYENFYLEQEDVTKNLIYFIFAAFYFILAFLFAVQIRRKKSKMFPIYSAILLTVILIFIFSREQATDFIKHASAVKKICGLGFVGLSLIELLILTVLSVPAAFEHSELAFNAKKSDGYKLADVIVGVVVFVLFILDFALMFGGKFKIFGDMFKKISVVVVLIIEIFVLGFFTYRLIKQKKKVAAVLFPIAVVLFEFALYSYSYGGWTIIYNVRDYLASGNAMKVIEGTFVLTHFAVIAGYGLYITSDYLITIFEARRQKLYNHREKYVYGDRRKFGDSIVKEWEASKMAQSGATSFADIAAAIEAQKEADLRESQGLQGIILNKDDITNDDEVQAALQAEQAAGGEKLSANEAEEDNQDDKKVKLTLTNGTEPTEFREKLMTLEGNKRGRYNKVRNRLMSYKKIKQKFSKTVDTYRYAGELVAKMSILGSTLRLHLALDPDSYDVNKYHQIDLSSKQKYIFVPFTLKLKGPKSVDLALQLIDELMKGFEIPQDKKYVDQDYAKQVAEELKAEGLLVETPVEESTEEAPAEKPKKKKAAAPAAEAPAEEAAPEAPVAEEAKEEPVEAAPAAEETPEAPAEETKEEAPAEEEKAE